MLTRLPQPYRFHDLVVLGGRAVTLPQLRRLLDDSLLLVRVLLPVTPRHNTHVGDEETSETVQLLLSAVLLVEASLGIHLGAYVSRRSRSTTQLLVQVQHDALASLRLQLLPVKGEVLLGVEGERRDRLHALGGAEVAVAVAVQTREHHLGFDLQVRGGDKENAERKRGAQVLNERDLRLLQLGQVVHDHDAAIRVLLEEAVVRIRGNFKNIVMLRSVVRALGNPRYLALNGEEEGYQIISVLRLVRLDASQRDMGSLDKETVCGAPFIRIDFVFDVETLVAPGRRREDKELQ